MRKRNHQRGFELGMFLLATVGGLAVLSVVTVLGVTGQL